METPVVALTAKHLRLIAFVFVAGFAAHPQNTQPAPDSPRPLPPQTEDPNRPAGLTQVPDRPNSWTDSQGRSYQRSSEGSWTNYDEGKANPYRLPDPLVLKNGEPVTDAETWWTRRRPEILEDFQREMYGRIPSGIPAIAWDVTATDRAAAGGLAIGKTVLGRIENSRYPAASPAIHITIYTPAHATGPAPLILALVAGPGGYGAPRPAAAGAVPPAVAPEPSAGSPLYQLLSIGWG